MVPERIFQIAEQIFVDPNTQYTFQFSSVHSEEVALGNLPPDQDKEVYMKMWDPTGQKCLTISFDRNGLRIRAELTNKADPPPISRVIDDTPGFAEDTPKQLAPEAEYMGIAESPGV